MAAEPLTYDSLKYVLQYMEPNRRLQISRCCPTIRSAERVTPLRINYLEFEPGKIKINNTIYWIGIYKKFHVGEAPEPFQKGNDQGGVMYEVDKFGNENEDDYTIVTPGDIEIGSEFSRLNGRRMRAPAQAAFGFDDSTIEGLEEQIRLKEQRTHGNDWFTELILQKYRSKLIPLQYQRDNAPTPFENLIQVNVTSEGSTYIERYSHNKKCHEAVKQLGIALFDGRKALINVRNFRVKAGINGDHVIFRLPIGVQFKTRSIRFGRSVTNAFSAFSSIIHESSFPLDHLHVDYFATAEATDPVVEGAKTITISCLKHDDTIEALVSMKNCGVHFKFAYLFSINTLKLFVRNRIRRELGSHLSFEIRIPGPPSAWLANLMREFGRGEVDNSIPVNDWMEEIQREFNGVAGERSVIIPIDDNTQLVVLHKDTIEADYKRPSVTVEVLVEDIKP